MKKILITGSKGQLGSELKKLSGSFSGFEMIFTDLPELDITDQNALDSFFKSHHVDFLVNCAAYTAVDKAESEPEIARIINAKAPEMLAFAALEYKFTLLHISTDYVFSGQHFQPYTEDYTADPQSVYGKTKLAGEEAIRASGANALIIRTSWLYSSFGHNFVRTILRLANERDEIRVVFDQIGTPTYAADLAESLLAIITNHDAVEGCRIYNYSNEGACSWYDFAKAIIENEGLNCKVLPIRSKEYPTPAPRPSYSVLDKSKIKNDYPIRIPWWNNSLVKCLGVIRTENTEGERG